MKKFLAVALALGIASSAKAATQDKNYEDAMSATYFSCRVQLQSKCWKPLADVLAQTKAPTTEQEREDQMFDYWILAKTAHWVGDFADSANFYDTTLTLAKGLKIKPDGKGNPSDIGSIVKIDLAALDLSAKDYSSAFRILDEITPLEKDLLAGDSIAVSTSFMRCAALIGLKRTAEADAALQDLLQKLDFQGESPWEGMPVGPQPIDPYDVGRRIAAYYLRIGNYDKAMATLQMIDTRRKETLAGAAQDAPRRRYWALGLAPADILDDEAAIYLAQGRDDQAESLLRTSLKMREPKADRQLKRLLTRLAALDRRKGNISEADEFLTSAATIKADESRTGADPFADTLGLAD